MEGKTTTAPDTKGSNRTRDPPSVDNRQLKTKTHKDQEDRHVGRKPESKTSASQFRDHGDESQHLELDDDDARDEGNSSDEVDDERNEELIQPNDQTTSDGVEDVEDMGNDNTVASESESESFVETYRSYRIHIRRAARREAEKEFLLNKRGLAGLPKRRKLDEQQRKDQRFCTWALRQIKRRIKALLEEEAMRGEFSSSDGLSESDEAKSWKMYGIIAEDKNQYLIAWKGINKITEQDHDDEWTAKKNVKGKDRREWEAYKREKANNEV